MNKGRYQTYSCAWLYIEIDRCLGNMLHAGKGVKSVHNKLPRPGGGSASDIGATEFHHKIPLSDVVVADFGQLNTLPTK